MLTCGSPWLIAAYRVLRRQSVPWHPPCALVRLILPVHIVYCFLRLLRGQTKALVLSIVRCFYSFLCSFQGAIEVLIYSKLQNDTETIFEETFRFHLPTFAGYLPVFLRLCFLLEAFYLPIFCFLSSSLTAPLSLRSHRPRI